MKLLDFIFTLCMVVGVLLGVGEWFFSAPGNDSLGNVAIGFGIVGMAGLVVMRFLFGDNNNEGK